MKRYQKRMLALLLGAMLLVGETVLPVMEIRAEESQEVEENVVYEEPKEQMNDVVAPRIMEIPYEQLVENDVNVQSQLQLEDNMVASQGYRDGYWDKYSTNYFYNLLPETQQAIWEALDEMCLELLKGTTDVEGVNIGGTDTYCTDIIFSSQITVDEICDLALFFRIANPQYYFLNTNIIYSYYQNQVGVSLGVYQKFAQGSIRMQETAKVKAKLEQWESQMPAQGTEFEKATKAHEIVMAATTYNYGATSQGVVTAAKDEEYITQSAYSTLLLGTTVCAGYSMAYEMLCNSMGVDTIAVTSNNHEWNKVRVNDSWYNVDCTWDDNDSTPVMYNNFMKNDQQFGENSAHIPVEKWNEYLPACTLTTNSSGYNRGSLPAVAGTVQKPLIVVTQVASGYNVKIASNTGNVSIYYTLNGTTPSPAYTKSKLYSGEFVTNNYQNIKAVAVKNTYLDSDVSSFSGKVSNNVTYAVAYQLNGGANNSRNLSKYNQGTNVTLYDPTRSGYVFNGWYINANFSGTPVKTISNISGNYTLYAKWTPIQYKVKFNKNGLKLKGSFSTRTYKYNSKYTLPKTSTKKKGYDLVWNTKKNGKGTSYKAGSKITNLTSSSGKTITLYARWVKHQYAVTYKLNGGKNGKNPKTYYVTTKTIKLKNPTRKGYKFVGWYSDKKCKKKVTQIKKGTTGNKTLYAKWKKK